MEVLKGEEDDTQYLSSCDISDVESFDDMPGCIMGNIDAIESKTISLVDVGGRRRRRRGEGGLYKHEVQGMGEVRRRVGIIVGSSCVVIFDLGRIVWEVHCLFFYIKGSFCLQYINYLLSYVYWRKIQRK